MTEKRYRVPYSKSSLEFRLPPWMHADIAVSQQTEYLKDVTQAIQDALAHPIGTPPLRELAKPVDRVCIVFTDSTRASPDHLLVSAILNELEISGIRDKDVTLLCGTGMHRPSTQTEKIAKLGAEVVAPLCFIDN